MCRPQHFGVEYEINPWMHVEQGVDREKAGSQWQALFRAYQELGQAVELVDPVPGLPDMVFTANAALVHCGKAVLARFHHPERQGEERHWRRALSDRGLQILEVSGGTSFEGAGDALFVGDRLFAGHGFRTDVAAHRDLARLLGVEVVSLHLVDPHFYHLDTCFCPLAPEVVMFAPHAFTRESARLVRRLVPHVIEVSPALARDFICNGVVVGDHLLSSTGVEQMDGQLHGEGLAATAFPMTEFLKAGGGVRCLTLELN
ncbi:MAG: dimethylarginine dimethylaminohydrolase family protein [Candidatus Dormibacteria bacterium]